MSAFLGNLHKGWLPFDVCGAGIRLVQRSLGRRVFVAREREKKKRDSVQIIKNGSIS